jgi:hypothetical protein
MYHAPMGDNKAKKPEQDKKQRLKQKLKENLQRRKAAPEKSDK